MNDACFEEVKAFGGHVWAYGNGYQVLSLMPDGSGKFRDHWGAFYEGKMEVAAEGGAGKFLDSTGKRLLYLFKEENLHSGFKSFDELFNSEYMYDFAVIAFFRFKKRCSPGES